MINKRNFITKKNGEPNCYCFCTKPELIENYDLAITDKTQTWDCHHKMEKYFPRETLKAIGWYYDCEPDELIFLTKEEHISLHHKGKSHSKETKRKISKTNKGREAWNKKKILCVETGIIYESTMEASRALNANFSNISAVCREVRKTANGYHWQFV